MHRAAIRLETSGPSLPAVGPPGAQIRAVSRCRISDQSWTEWEFPGEAPSARCAAAAGVRGRARGGGACTPRGAQVVGMATVWVRETRRPVGSPVNSSRLHCGLAAWQGAVPGVPRG